MKRKHQYDMLLQIRKETNIAKYAEFIGAVSLRPMFVFALL
jgi:hypothetical protein